MTGTGTLTVTFAHAQTEKPTPLGLHVAVPGAPLPHEHATCVPGAHWGGAAMNGDMLVAGSALAAKEMVESAAANANEVKNLAIV